MSLSLKHIDTFITIDPRINQHQNNEYLIKKGGSFYSCMQINANNTSSNSCTFTFNSPSVKNFIDRSFYIKHIIDFDIVGVNSTPGTSIINLGVSDGLQFCPLSHKLWDTITLTLNGNAVTVYSSDIMPILDRTNYHNKMRKYNKSITPCSIMDSHMNYEDIADVTNPYFSLYSMNGNEVGQYLQGEYDGRGAFKYVSNTKISDNRSIVRYELIEAIPVSPCIDTDYFYEKAFYGVNTISLNITFNTSAIANGAMWSHNNILGNPLTSITTTIVSAQLLLQIINPPDTYIPYHGIISYKYDRFDRYLTPMGIIPANTKVAGFISNSITIPIFPSRFFIAARRNPATMNFNTTETFGYLENVNITLKSKNGIIASFNPQQLFELSVENGCRLSWSQWSRDVGSILIVPIDYCNLMDDESAALQEQLQVQVRADVTNLNLSKAIDMELIIIAVNPGIYNIEPATQSVNTQLGIVTKSDILNSALSPHVDYHLIKEMYGGDFSSDIKNFGHKLSAFAQKASPYVKKGYDLAKQYGPQIASTAATLAPLIGLGDDDMDGGARRRRRRQARR